MSKWGDYRVLVNGREKGLANSMNAAQTSAKHLSRQYPNAEIRIIETTRKTQTSYKPNIKKNPRSRRVLKISRAGERIHNFRVRDADPRRAKRTIRRLYGRGVQVNPQKKKKYQRVLSRWRENLPNQFTVQNKQGMGWRTLAWFPSLNSAKNYAHMLARAHPSATIRVFKPGKPRYRKNPAAREPSRAAEVNRAANLYESFTGHQADQGTQLSLPPAPKTGFAIGPVLLIGYSTIRDGKRENYVHRFAAHARPLLAASHDGRSVFMLGGAYTFTDRGIVDRKRSR